MINYHELHLYNYLRSKPLNLPQTAVEASSRNFIKCGGFMVRNFFPGVIKQRNISRLNAAASPNAFAKLQTLHKRRLPGHRKHGGVDPNFDASKQGASKCARIGFQLSLLCKNVCIDENSQGGLRIQADWIAL